MGTGVGSMPRRKQPLKRRTFIKFYVSATLVLAALALGQFSRYVNTTVKPTLHQLAEYEARAATVQAMQSAVSAQLQTMPTLCEALYIQRGELVQLDTARANAAEVQLTAAVQQSLAALPKTDYLIPFGSLTNNSLLSGLGPGWEFTLQPQGYVQGAVRETAESLSINTTRCTAVLELTGKGGRALTVQASSLGGGRIMVNKLDGIEVNFTGESNTLVVRNQDDEYFEPAARERGEYERPPPQARRRRAHGHRDRPAHQAQAGGVHLRAARYSGRDILR